MLVGAGNGAPCRSLGDCLPAMTSYARATLTELLNLGLNGDGAAGERAFSLVYAQLRRAAAAQLGSYGQGHTLSPTALVNEAYLKLVTSADLSVNDRAHFFALSARAMRQLCTDEQRQKHSGKHGGGLQRVDLSEDLVDESAHQIDYVDLDRALTQLESLDPRAARVVELHYYSGLNFMEIAELLGISDKTVRRDWTCARAFLLLQV
jgi:RNA polymerase sigma factor (TIGR02999 family)